MEEAASKADTKLEIKPDNQSFSSELHGSLQGHKTPFFKSRSRRRRSDTWVISVFIILLLVAFLTMMLENNCRINSHGDCVAKALRMLSFQPLYENPLLGPSSSTLDKVGALRKSMLVNHKVWHFFLCPWLHAGLIHLIVNLAGLVFLGFYLEQEFGPLRVGIIYLISALLGTLVTAVFVRDSPVVCSSGAQFGLLGAAFSTLLTNWEFFTDKVKAMLILSIVFTCNFIIGFLPYTGNYSNVGGFISGFLLGFVLLTPPHLNRPTLRIVCLTLLAFLLVGFLVLILLGINISKYCRWCGYFDCIPSKSWCCSDVSTSCEIMTSDTEITLTCISNGNFKVFPYTHLSKARAQDLCTLLCS
ncbi:inactive RHOMBOID-like protein 8 [Euphorbia lathyris]|uniref:inactive RHOMBOID-like protein 8 n=1 Tax=Euphorbia lathyris TaxID=212925 RepID=UPI003313F996